MKDLPELSRPIQLRPRQSVCSHPQANDSFNLKCRRWLQMEWPYRSTNKLRLAAVSFLLIVFLWGRLALPIFWARISPRHLHVSLSFCSLAIKLSGGLRCQVFLWWAEIGICLGDFLGSWELGCSLLDLFFNARQRSGFHSSHWRRHYGALVSQVFLASSACWWSVWVGEVGMISLSACWVVFWVN